MSGVRVNRPTVWDGNNRGKLKGALKAEWFLIQYVDQQGKECKTYALYAGGNWYLPRNGTEMHDLEGHVTTPSSWFAKELGKLTQRVDPARAEKNVEVPTDDAVEID